MIKMTCAGVVCVMHKHIIDLILYQSSKTIFVVAVMSLLTFKDEDDIVDDSHGECITAVVTFTIFAVSVS